MLVSSMRMLRPVLPVLVGIVCLMLSGAPSPAQTVLETVHYQAELGLNCAGHYCIGRFPKLGTKRRLNVTRMTCVLGSTAGSPFGSAYINLRDSNDEDIRFSQYLPLDYSSPNGIHTLNRAVDMQVGPNEHIFVFLTLAVSGVFPANGAACTASGTLDRLQ